MNESEITALAHEYAEECAKGFAPADMPNCLKNEATGILVCNAEDMLKWLSTRFCLVEKEAVRKEYKQAAEDYDPYDSMYSNRGKLDLLESLFPELTKEVEGIMNIKDWIPVSETLPEPMQRVLVWIGDEALVCWYTGSGRFKTTLRSQERYSKDSVRGEKIHLSPCREDVTDVATHWMPIVHPEIAKEVEG